MIISQVYAAAVGDVWDACTNPERIPRWFVPVSGDLRLGGRYQIEGNASGTIERCDPAGELRGDLGNSVARPAGSRSGWPRRRTA